MSAQCLDALTIANRKRVALAQLRRDLRSGAVQLADVLNDPPDCISHYTVLDVLELMRTNSRAISWKRELGAAALFDRVNVLVAVADASPRTIDWAVRRGQRNVRRAA